VDVRGDFLVIGSGIAGLRAALTLAEAGDVIILTKASPDESNTGYAQGGIAAALGPDDSPALHAEDTRAAGDGLCDPDAVDILVREGPKYVVELLEWGAHFDRETDGSPSLGREAAHSVRRVLHARDATGREIGRLLWSRVSSSPRIRVLQDADAIELVIANGICTSARYMARDGVGTVTAGRTMLATGGAGQVFRETTNPTIATGDGIAMAAHAGARVADLEFVQFHPTVMSVPGRPRFLLSEALRGEGARLINEDDDRFMQRYEPAGELASRDLVSRAIVREMERTHAPVYLSLAHMDRAFVHERFPTIAQACANAGLDLASDRIPVSPAAHYIMGGVETDLDGRTSVPGLFAAGEVACTGVHGANRLASNSLLEGLVFGARAADAMTGPLCPARLREHEVVVWQPDARRPPSIDLPLTDDVRALMWRNCGLLREAHGIDATITRLDAWHALVRTAPATRVVEREFRRLRSIITVGLLIARAALRREESRGGHFRSDFPDRDDIKWQKHVSDVLEKIPNPKSQIPNPNAS
jgi:L-aspartate oxidase